MTISLVMSSVTWWAALPLSYGLWCMVLAFPRSQWNDNGVVEALGGSAASYDAQSSSHSVKSAHFCCHYISYGSLGTDTAPHQQQCNALWNSRKIHIFMLWKIIITKYCLNDMHYMHESHALFTSSHQRTNDVYLEVYTSSGNTLTAPPKWPHVINLQLLSWLTGLGFILW